MNINDRVCLVIHTGRNHLLVSKTRLEASRWMQWWHNEMDTIRNMSWWKFYWHKLTTLGRPAPVSLNLLVGGEEDPAMTVACLDWRNVSSMYCYDISPNPQERIAAAIEKQLGEGEDWKGGEDE